MFDNVDWSEIGRATVDTLLMLGGSMVLTVILGVPLGVLVASSHSQASCDRLLTLD